MTQKKILHNVRERRARRVRSRIRGTANKPRLSVFRSNRYMYAQLIDDTAGKTLAAASSREIKSNVSKSDTAREIGKMLGEKASRLGLTKAVFDRGRYRYHGRVKALAEGAKEGGLQL